MKAQTSSKGYLCVLEETLKRLQVLPCGECVISFYHISTGRLPSGGRGICDPGSMKALCAHGSQVMRF